MGFDDCRLFGEQTASFVSAIGQMGYSVKEASHAIGKLSEACSSYSHVEGYSSSLPRRQPTVKNVVMMSIVRKGSLPERQITIDKIKEATLTVDNEKIDWNVLEKNFGPFNKGDLIFHKDGWNFN